MNSSIFYTAFAEGAKFLFYVILALLIGIGLWRRTAKSDPNWQNWIHAAVFAHFLVTGIYGGIRMLTTDETTNMLTRRIFAFEAYFNFAAAAFYFLFIQLLNQIKQRR
jgi:hypothetical protein